MKIIAKERGLGKTTELVKRSIETGYPIIVANVNQREAVSREYCKQSAGLKPMVYTVYDFTSLGLHSIYKNILIDELEFVLNQLLDVKIDQVSFTGDISIETKEKKIVEMEVEEIKYQEFNMRDKI